MLQSYSFLAVFEKKELALAGEGFCACGETFYAVTSLKVVHETPIPVPSLMLSGFLPVPRGVPLGTVPPRSLSFCSFSFLITISKLELNVRIPRLCIQDAEHYGYGYAFVYLVHGDVDYLRSLCPGDLLGSSWKAVGRVHLPNGPITSRLVIFDSDLRSWQFASRQRFHCSSDWFTEHVPVVPP